MGRVSIEWLHDYSDCDQAGCSGGYCEGARVKIDGEIALDLTPRADCFGGDNWDRDEVFGLILRHLGHELVVEAA